MSEYKKNYPLIYALKPLTIALVMVAVLLYSPMNGYSKLVLAGLAFSMLGDIFLMLRQQKFISGLISFLIAHLFYIAAFYQHLPTTPVPWDILWFAVPALAVFGYLYPGLGKLKMPVTVYVSAIVAMGYYSLEVYLAGPSTYTLSALIGAAVFMLSDATLAINKFRRPFHAAQLVILSTYYVAQWLIAYSTFI